MSATREESLPSPLLITGLIGGLAAMMLGLFVWLGRGVPATTVPARASTPAAPPPPPAFFAEITHRTGVKLTYRNGEGSDLYTLLETVGGGVALIDYDGDGLLDLFLPGGGFFTGKDGKEIKGRPCKLYRNLGNVTFQDVTAEVGLDRAWFYTHGAAVADFDCDGWPDLLVTGWQRLALFRNVPVDPGDAAKGRKFQDVAAQAGLPTGLWTTSAAWGDLDGDGYPDLYLCQYVDWSFEKDPGFVQLGPGRQRDIPPPKLFLGLPPKLFHNNGDGTFIDISKEVGLRDSKGLGVLMVDVNGDGKPDMYIANNTEDNFLYMNRTKRRDRLLLEEKGADTATARDGDGSPNGSHGLDAGDPFGLGRPSLWVTNYENELHALYKNDCSADKEYFLYATRPSGLAAMGQITVGWGTGFLDLDHDGWEDLFFTDGHDLRHPQRMVPRGRCPGLLRNTGGGKFNDIRWRGGPFFQEQHIGRGAALGDLDNDGKIDVVISHLNEPVAVLRNVADTDGNRWLGIELVGRKNRDVVGSRVVLDCGGGRQTRFAKGGGSYLSSGDRRFVFGLGPAIGPRLRVTVDWSWGETEAFDVPAADCYWRLVEGGGVLPAK